jgi:hypothetical protein
MMSVSGRFRTPLLGGATCDLVQSYFVTLDALKHLSDIDVTSEDSSPPLKEISMMPTIRIDDDVFQGLKSLAEPFTDTPNSVIRRLLAERHALPIPPSDAVSQVQGASDRCSPSARKAEAPTTRHVPATKLTPQPIYEDFLLYVLAMDFKGKADKHKATKRVIELMESRGFIGSADRERVSTGETKAENTTAWARNALKDAGFIGRLSRRGTWEVTPEGMLKAQSIQLPTNGR